MDGLLRSKEMQLVQLFVQSEVAHETVDELGRLGCIEFRDLNAGVNAFQRNFVDEVKRCDEMERKLRFFVDEVNKQQEEDPSDLLVVRTMVGGPDIGAATASSSSSVANSGLNREALAREKLETLETHLNELEKELLQLNGNQERLDRSSCELVELLHVLRKDSMFFDESQSAASDDPTVVTVKTGDGSESAPGTRTNAGAHEPLLLREDTSVFESIRFGYVTGVIPRERLFNFERVLWRTTRGNLFMRSSEIESKIKDPQTNKLVEKNVFIVFFQGQRIQAKINKICESFGANVYDIPSSTLERTQIERETSGRLDELRSVMKHSREHRRRVLGRVVTHLSAWIETVKKEKAIYHAMGKFDLDVTRKCLIAEGWCPKDSIDNVTYALRRATERSGALVPSVLNILHTKEQPPTYFETNKLTAPFQAMVEAYGVARYREINPTVFTIISFPWLVALMFGDVGHGSIVLCFGLYLVLRERQLERSLAGKSGELMAQLFEARYVVLLMGAFSVYVGALYNECFALPLSLFESAWDFPDATSAGVRRDEDVYSFGVDSAWLGKQNELEFYNSLKMKLSIYFGVTQMLLGIILSAFNHVHSGKKQYVLAETVPQLIFLLALFGYMVLMILIKWSTDWTGNESNAPSIISTMIDMFLSPGSVSKELYAGQAGFQVFLLLCAFASVPWMLLAKPLILKREHERNQYMQFKDDDEEAEEFSFGDVMVHQVIHVIEFVLGAVSNTASYLRLWALSLAHSELSKVFWGQIMVGALESGSFFSIFISFAVFASSTFAIILGMESLSACLHALRLQWVEFQNKFYAADGRRFLPFSFERILKGGDEE